MPSIPKVALNGEHIFVGFLRDTLTLVSSYGLLNSNENGFDQSLHGLTARKLGSSNSLVNLEVYQKYIIQVVATVMASLSITAAITAIYWFCLMRRNFRRNLVLLLILSDCFKSFCYIMFSGVVFTNGQIQTADTFCQASGYMLQTGLEACDFAVLFISLHMTLQIFPLPNSIIGYDGLYNVRYWVYAIWFLLPNVTAGLAFINDNGAYQVQGAWCWLPVRPFWYRLALAWVPRYIITFAILCFAIAIYVHVGSEMKLFGRERDRTSSVGLDSCSEPDLESMANTSRAPTVRGDDSAPPEPASADVLMQNSHSFMRAQSGMNARRCSLPTWVSPFDGQAIAETPPGARSATASRRGSRQVAFHFPEEEEPISPFQTSGDRSSPPMPSLQVDSTRNAPDTIEEHVAHPSSLQEIRTNASASANSSIEAAGRKRSRAIKRQVRSLFIYPVAYMIFWTIPFIGHCMNYSDYYAAHPVFAVSVLQSFFITSLGLADVIIFSWREQPWRHIAGSDGTFLGSFCFWRFKQRPSYFRRTAHAEQENEKRWTDGDTGLMGFLKRLTWRRLSSSAGTHSSTSTKTRNGGADSTVREREMAHERLEMERSATEKRQVSRADQPDRFESTTRPVGARDWFDHLEEDDEVSMKDRRPTWSG